MRRPTGRLSVCGSRASSNSAPWPRSAARRSPASTCRPRSVSSRNREARRDRSRREAGRERPAAARPDPADPPAGDAGPYERRTGSEDAADTNEFIGFLQKFLLAFAGIALFVGSFVIANSLSITIAQRTREFATLRTLGASRRQVLGSIAVESLIIGVAASVVGLFLGLGLAKALFWLFDSVGFTLPNSGLLFQTRTVVVALLVGVLVTLIASLRPALRATGCRRLRPYGKERRCPSPGLRASGRRGQ